jgi:hypothetical protein
VARRAPFQVRGGRDCTVVECRDRMELGPHRSRRKPWPRRESGWAVWPSMATMCIGSNGGRMKVDAVCWSVARADGRHEELTPQGFNVRTRVHEYGGRRVRRRRRADLFLQFLRPTSLFRRVSRTRPAPRCHKAGLAPRDYSGEQLSSTRTSPTTRNVVA